jgi:hypothetical protein
MEVDAVNVVATMQTEYVCADGLSPLHEIPYRTTLTILRRLKRLPTPVHHT